jgi:hypothetical protein
MPEIRECPFCGIEPEIVQGATEYYIHCHGCDMLFSFDEFGHNGIYDNRETLIEIWNLRAE